MPFLRFIRQGVAPTSLTPPTKMCHLRRAQINRARSSHSGSRAPPREENEDEGAGGFFLTWLLAWVSGAIGCATPSAAPKASQAVARETAVAAQDILQDMRVVDRDVNLIFALSDSARRTYSVFEATDPFRVIVALPNTTSEDVPTPMAVGSEILNAIETTTVAYDLHPYTKVVIKLNRETAYRIGRVG